MKKTYRYCVPLIVWFGLSLFTGCQAERELVLVAAEGPAETQSIAQRVAPRTRSAAVAVLGSLNDEQHKQAVRPIKGPLRKDWHFVPRQREGVMLGDLDTNQKTLVHKLMQTALSDSGYLKATDIIWQETVLFDMSKQNPMRDPGKYALLIFGDPADENAAWGWRLEGHHLTINLTYTPEAIGVTPLFFGTNPAVVQQGPLAGKRVLADEHDLAVELVKSMDEQQRKQMMLAGKPRDIITGPGREASLREPAGISFTDLSLEQARILFRLMSTHRNNFDQAYASDILTRLLMGKDVPPLYFAWAGPIDAGEAFYYRIYNGNLVIEYSCQGKNHVHCVIHDLTDPLQEDLLKKHFEQHGHGLEQE